MVLHLEAKRTLSALSVDELVRLVPALLSECRDIRFEAGVCVDRQGVRREGLRVVEGVHPIPGCRYSLAVSVPAPPALTDEERAELRKVFRHSGSGRAARAAAQEDYHRRAQELLSSHPKTTQVKRYETTLQRDEPGRFEIRVLDQSSGVVAEIAILGPAGQPKVRVDANGSFTGKWPRRGQFRASGGCDLSRIPAKHSLGSQIEGSFDHRHLRGDGHVHIGSRGDSWEVRIRMRIGGKGLLLRPATTALAYIAGGRARRAFRQSVEIGPDITAELRSQLAQARLKSDYPDHSESMRYARSVVDDYMKRILESDPASSANANSGGSEDPAEGRATDP